MSCSRRAVLTGIGISSSIGMSPDAYWNSMSQGRSGIRSISIFDASGLSIRIAGEIVGFDAKQYIDKKERKSIKLMARSIQLAVAAAQLALDDGKVDKQTLDPTRFGVEFGSGLISSELEEMGPAAQCSANCQPGNIDLEKWGEQGIPSMTPLWMLKYLPNMPACHVSILHNAQGPSNTITESEVAGLLAIGEAYRIISRDQADIFLTGGAESRLNPLSMSRVTLFQSLSRRNDAPEKACRPFDRQRDGSVVAEGAGVFVIEDLEHARKRGARIYAEVVGFGSAFDRHRSGAGIARAARAALKEAGIGPQDLDHVNAHGLGTIATDIWEAKAIREIFGSGPMAPVFAPKSYFGNMGAASGPAELVASLLAMEHGILPPTLNFEEPDPACDIPVAAGSSRPVTRPYFMKLGFTEMGQCAALVCRKM